MRRVPATHTLILVVLARSASAGLLPPPVTATVVTFDDVPSVTDVSQSRCALAELEAAGKKAEAVAACHARAVQDGAALGR
jgi:hypothetical protein